MSDRLHVTVVGPTPRETVHLQLPTTGDGDLVEPWPTMLDAAARAGYEVQVARMVETRERWEPRRP